jgi:hypothetical protein
MEPTLLTAQQIAAQTSMPVPVICELLRGFPLVSLDDSTGDRKYNELDVLRVQIGCRMLANGVRWPMVHSCLDEMAYLSWDELQEALKTWAPVHPKTQASMAITITTLLVVAFIIGVAVGKFL